MLPIAGERFEYDPLWGAFLRFCRRHCLKRCRPDNTSRRRRSLPGCDNSSAEWSVTGRHCPSLMVLHLSIMMRAKCHEHPWLRDLLIKHCKQWLASLIVSRRRSKIWPDTHAAKICFVWPSHHPVCQKMKWNLSITVMLVRSVQCKTACCPCKICSRVMDFMVRSCPCTPKPPVSEFPRGSN